MSIPGSYANGFAPRDGQPLYPELWRGCVGAWAPCLGPTGLTLRGWSGAAKHGTLTNMDAGTDWVANQGRYALDLDGTNDYVVNSAFSFPAVGSLSVWMYPRDLSSATLDGQVAVCTFNNYVGIVARSSAIQGLIYNAAYNRTTYSATANQWYHALLTWDGANTSRLYVNGILRDTASAKNAGNPALRAQIYIGTYSSGGYFNGQVDDVRVYDRQLSPSVISLLSQRRGIPYEMAIRRRGRVAGFRAYWAARKAQIIGGGLN